MAIKGLINESAFTTRFTERPESWRDGILLLEPNGDAPLFALTAALENSGSVDDSVVHWFEESLPTYKFAVNGAHTDAVLTITVDSGANNLKIGDILSVSQTGEHVVVTAKPASDTAVKVSRGFGTTDSSGVTASTSAYGYVAATAITAEDAGSVILIGSIYGEGGLMPEARSFNAGVRETYCQIFKDSIGITGSMDTTNFRTGDQWQNAQRRCAARHAIGIERSLFYSRKSKGTQNSMVAYSMSGVLEQIPKTNSFDTPSAGMTMEKFEELSETMFLYGSNQKMAFVGQKCLSGIQRMVRRNVSSFEITPATTEFGMRVRTLFTPHGELVLKSHPQFNYIPEWRGNCVVLDMANLEYCHKKDRDTQWLPDLEENDRDGRKAGFMTDCALKVMHPETHYFIKNWTDGAKDA